MNPLYNLIPNAQGKLPTGYAISADNGRATVECETQQEAREVCRALSAQGFKNIQVTPTFD